MKKDGVCDCEVREVMSNGELGKSVKVKWLRARIGTLTNPDV